MHLKWLEIASRALTMIAATDTTYLLFEIGRFAKATKQVLVASNSGREVTGAGPGTFGRGGGNRPTGKILARLQR